MVRRARRATLAVVAIMSAAALPGCGGGGDRDAVRAYIEDANAIQAEGQADLTAANAAYRRLSRGRLSGRLGVAELQDTVERLRATRSRLERLPAPEPAAGLRRRLLVVFDHEIRLAGESAALAVYLPASRRALTRLSRDAGTLRQDLRRAADVAAQERALTVYGERLGAIEDRLRDLSPPPVLVDAHRSQLLRLTTARSLAARVRVAVRDQDGPEVARLLLRFGSVFSTTRTDAALQRASLRGYRDRLRELSVAVGALRREQGAVERALE